MKTHKFFGRAILLMLANSLYLHNSQAQNMPVITAEGKNRHITDTNYQAVIAENGALSSLKINGQEFLRVRGASRGAYFFQNGNIELSQIEQPEPNVVVATGEKASVRYEFKSDALIWNLTNSSEKHMNFFIVFDPAIGVGRCEGGEWAKTPVNQSWKHSTWLNEKAKLEMGGATRVWGPWNGLDQVWEATLAPKETRVVELRPGIPDATEIAKGKELLAAAKKAEGLTLPSFFSDNMVLQREMPNPIWGTAAPGETITVSVEKQSHRAIADADGKWMVQLVPLPVGGPYQITVQGKTTKTLQNVLCGDVWICSGQSNMAYTMNETIDGKEAALSAHDDKLRLFKATLGASDTPLNDVAGKWTNAQPDSVGRFSAVGYFFGQKLRQELNVPIALISTAWGGTQIEAWLSPASVQADPDFEAMAARKAKAIEAKGEARAKNNDPSALYHGMNVPMAPLAIKGVAWYQGEANIGRAFQYRRLFPLMINDWRPLWKRHDLPFVWVQLPGIGKIPENPPSGSGQAELREAQAMALALPNTAMAVTLELGDPNDIHPKYKKEVGNRLALATLQNIYRRNVVGSGPVYTNMKIEGKAIRLQFQELGGGLVAKEGELQGFAIAGADKKWIWGDAKIEGDTVVVSSPLVPNPVAVRYGWADTPPFVTLYNKAGLPAAPFRTDDWPGLTISNK